MQRLDLSTPTQESSNPERDAQPPVDVSTIPNDNQSSVYSQKTEPMAKKRNPLVLALSIVAVLAGVATGFGGHKLSANSSFGGNSAEPLQQVAGETVNKGDVFGSSDKDAFKDTAEGYLEAGGIEGEGSHKLIRPGGVSQTVYLTSTVTDLDKLVGMEVKIWGETFKGQKAGWLMDVGRIEVLNPEGTAPVEKE